MSLATLPSVGIRELGVHDAIRLAQAILEATCRIFGISRSRLLSQLRSGWIVHPRSVAMYLVRKETALSYPACARVFGGRHHTTVLAACERIEDALHTDSALAGQIEEIRVLARALARPRPGTATTCRCGASNLLAGPPDNLTEGAQ